MKYITYIFSICTVASFLFSSSVTDGMKEKLAIYDIQKAELLNPIIDSSEELIEKQRWNSLSQTPIARDCEEGEFECWDGSCVADEADCPDQVSCSDAGGIDSWISDGYCDSSNNNVNCAWDGGDCCGSTCLTSTYDCQGGTSGSSWAACLSECLDPDANDDCCVDDTCPFTCEGNGLITC